MNLNYFYSKINIEDLFKENVDFDDINDEGIDIELDLEKIKEIIINIKNNLNNEEKKINVLEKPYCLNEEKKIYNKEGLRKYSKSFEKNNYQLKKLLNDINDKINNNNIKNEKKSNLDLIKEIKQFIKNKEIPNLNKFKIECLKEEEKNLN